MNRKLLESKMRELSAVRACKFLIRDWSVFGKGLSVCERAHNCFFFFFKWPESVSVSPVNSALSRSHSEIKEISWVVFLLQWFLVSRCRDVQLGYHQKALPYMTNKCVLESTSTLRLGTLHRKYISNTNSIIWIPLFLSLIYQWKDTHTPQDSWCLDWVHSPKAPQCLSTMTDQFISPQCAACSTEYLDGSLWAPGDEGPVVITAKHLNPI